MADIEEITRKYRLARSVEYQEIKKEFLDFILKASSNASFSSEKIQGMLLLLNEVEKWIRAYKEELAKRK